MDRPRDITYCANPNCDRDCERNLRNHDFRNEVISISMFGPDKSGKCPCFMGRKEQNMRCDKCNSKMKTYYFSKKRLPYYSCPKCGNIKSYKENK